MGCCSSRHDFDISALGISFGSPDDTASSPPEAERPPRPPSHIKTDLSPKEAWAPDSSRASAQSAGRAPTLLPGMGGSKDSKEAVAADPPRANAQSGGRRAPTLLTSHINTNLGAKDAQGPDSARASTKAESRAPTLLTLTSPGSAASALSSPFGSMRTLFGRSSVMALGRYSFNDKGVPLGEGAWSVCFLGADVMTGGKVAVKAYKAAADASREGRHKFKRQVSVLLELQKPLQTPADARLWSPDLARSSPSDLFVQMLDYSRDASGAPGPSPADGSMHVVTELAERTLKSFLKERQEQSRPLLFKEVREIAEDIILAVAGLHAKGLVHLDMKPENVMLCQGRWKLIDMDCCFRAGKVLRHDDATVSFSPVYCSPEFARLASFGDGSLACGGDDSIVASPALDVWCVGVTLAELVELRPLLSASYARHCRGTSRTKGQQSFLRWLGRLSAAPKLQKPSDPSFRELLTERLLVPKQAARATLAESLSAPFLRKPAEHVTATTEMRATMCTWST